jgi:hypothetical protein
VTIVKDAEVVTSIMTDLAVEGGFIAIGSMALPSVGGGRVGAVSIKGPGEKIARYPAALRRAIANCEQYVPMVGEAPIERIKPIRSIA